VREQPKILYVVNSADFFLSHRLSLAIAASEGGYEVHVATPTSDSVELLAGHGFAYHPVRMHRQGMRLWSEVLSLACLVRLYLRVQPTLVHHVTIKPVLYGGFAARIARVPAVVSALTGLGYLFSQTQPRKSLVRHVVKLGLRVSLAHRNIRVVFQNPDDQQFFVEERLLRAGDSVLIRGSGVNMSEFVPRPIGGGEPIVVLASRMLWDKGLKEFVEAAERLKQDGVAARFVLVGKSDPGNPAAVPVEQLEEWDRRGAVEWWGHRKDMPEVLAKAQAVCLPTYYGEGVPKVLIEAAAAGRPIVTTDAPGCREIVRDKENGLLVPPRNVSLLVTALRRLIEDPDLCTAYGMRGRQIAEAEFSLGRVVEETLAIYAELLP
jgi:glycosyltransferase involved in cell wall biosynthesis